MSSGNRKCYLLPGSFADLSFDLTSGDRFPGFFIIVIVSFIAALGHL